MLEAAPHSPQLGEELRLRIEAELARVEPRPEFAVFEAARDEVDAALARARELLPPETDFEFPENIDEAPFPDGVDRLLDLVQAGPRRPLATQAEALAELHAQHKQTDANAVARAVKEALGFGAPPRPRSDQKASARAAT